MLTGGRQPVTKRAANRGGEKHLPRHQLILPAQPLRPPTPACYWKREQILSAREEHFADTHLFLTGRGSPRANHQNVDSKLACTVKLILAYLSKIKSRSVGLQSRLFSSTYTFFFNFFFSNCKISHFPKSHRQQGLFFLAPDKMNSRPLQGTLLVFPIFSSL